MLRVFRWFKNKMGAELPALPRPRARSRFLAARFKEPDTETVFKLGPRPELGYRLYLPSGALGRHSVPLLVMLHGCQQTALEYAEGTRMNALAEEARCAVLYPEQGTQSNALRCWNWFEPASIAGRGEAALIARLIQEVTKRRRIDPRRIYVAGMSAGGAMACLLAIRHSELFAACAIHSGVMYGVASSPIEALSVMRSGATPGAIDRARRLMGEAGSEAAVPTLVIHGDVDTTVNPINADQIIEQSKERIEWSDPAAGALQTSGPVLTDGGGRSSRRQDFTQRGRLMLRQIVVQGLGHAWSGGDNRYPFNDADGPNAGRLILEFVMSHQREVRPIAAARAMR